MQKPTNYLLTIISLLFLFQIAYGQEEIDIQIIPKWEKGDSLNYIIHKEKTETVNGELVKSNKGSLMAKFKVLDVVANGYKIQWLYQTDFESLGIPEKYHDALKDFSQINVVYRTDQNGVFQEVLNTAELMTNLEQSLKKFFSILKKEEPEMADDMDFAMSQTIELFKDKQLIESIAFKEIKLLHGLYGNYFTSKEKETFQEDAPNILGSIPLSIKSSIWLDNIQADQVAIIKKESEIDEEELKQLIGKIQSQFDLKNKDDLNSVKIELKDRNELHFDLKTGNILKAASERIVDGQDVKGKTLVKELVSIELVK